MRFRKSFETLLFSRIDPSVSKENLGIIVHYKVKVRLVVAFGG